MEETCGCIGCEIVKVKDLIRNAIWNSGAQGLVIGISGGIDSAVAGALAVKAVGKERVIGVFMPASEHGMQDLDDAQTLCDFLGVELLIVSLEKVLAEFLRTPHITATPIAAGNISARLRMTVLYNIAASRDYLVCGTSNKTEYLVGYSTKWGDGAADIQPLLHLYKKDVYAIARELELPARIIQKAPTAGFFPGQTDEEDLGMSYAELDDALFTLELNNYVPTTEFEGKILEMMKKSEHKRHLPASKFR